MNKTVDNILETLIENIIDEMPAKDSQWLEVIEKLREAKNLVNKIDTE